MPIPVKNLLEAERPLEERIMGFLGRNPDIAFTTAEIIDGLEERQGGQVVAFTLSMMEKAARGAFIHNYAATLKSLSETGLIKVRLHLGQYYFSIH